VPSSSRALAFVAGCAWLLGAGTARAQLGGTTGTTGTGGTTGASALAASDFFIGVQAQAGSNLSDFAVARFFNKATCDCTVPIFIFYALLPSGQAKRAAIVATTGSVEFWIGQNCDNPFVRNAQCKNLGIETLVTFLQHGQETLATDARVMSTFTLTGTFATDGGTTSTTATGTFTPTPDCTAPVQSFTQNVYLLVSLAGTQNYDVVASRPVQVDLTPPPPPANVTVEPGNEALVLNWTQVDTSLFPDLFGYQVLCKRGANLQVFPNGTFTPGFVSCPATSMGTGPEGLEEAFVCSPLLSATATSFRVEILQNGIPYGVTVVSVDKSGNASAPDVQYGVPATTKSFYAVYREPPNAGGATGGLCALGPPVRRGWTALPVVAGAAILTLALARHRRRRR